MKQTIGIQIDVTKIEKKRLFEGKKGTYLDAVILLNDEPDQYGQNGMVIQSVSKEEREQGVQGSILGNVKILGGANNAPTGNRSEKVELDDGFDDMDDDLPF